MNLWERFTHIYGHRFATAYGESALNAEGQLTDVAQTWAAGLAGITGEQLAVGLRACIKREDTWPPTLPEFRALCAPGRGPIYHQDLSAREDLGYLRLPRTPMTAAQISAAVAAMREKLTTKQEDTSHG